MHLLATELATLEEADVAVDLAQSPAEIVVLSFSDSDLSALAAAWIEGAESLPTLRLANLKRLRHPMSVDLYLDTVVARARLVIVRCLGGLDYWRYGLERIADLARDNGLLLAALPGDDRADPRLASLSTLAPSPLAQLERFFREGGPHNIRQALRFAATLLGRALSWSAPQTVGPIAVHRNLLSPARGRGWERGLHELSQPPLRTSPPSGGEGKSGPEARGPQDDDDRPVALILFYRANLMAADTAPIDALAEALERQGLAPLAVAVTSLKDPAIHAELGSLLARHKPAVILNTTAFSALRADDSTILDSADVPVLQVVLAGSAREAWEQSPRGLAPADLAMNVALPELDGRLLTRAISFKAERPADPRLQFATVRHEPVADRVGFVARLAANWVRLGRTARHERRLAMVVSDYPARGGRSGYAVGLDTAASAARILRLLHDEGYDVGGRDWTAQDIECLLRGEVEQIEIASEPAVRLPILRCGKVMVLLQPDRGAAGDRKSGYHDPNQPPNEAYVAVYAWLRETVGIHALIHLGTHGTLEWLPGKALALSSACWPEVVLGPLPVIYPFIVNNPAEAMQAKRRLAAVTIGHLTPPLSTAGLHGPLAELEGIIEEYAAADGLDRRRLRLLENEIVERAWSSGLAGDCGLVRGEPNRQAIAKLDAQLCDIKELSIRDGLHVFGQQPDEPAIAALAAATGDEPAVRASAGRECANLLAGLDGRRVAAGPAGAPSRGRADVLPTGRNLTSIDPRAIPTRTAGILGRRAAEEVVRRYLQDHGEPPRALVIDLWASASLRTGGDDLAQALWYLGVTPTWDSQSSRVTGIEVQPLAVLDRPRIDVTLRISGLFRDIFETQIALFDLAVRRVAELDEPADDNPLAEARRRGQDLARVFGAAPGRYGADVADRVLDSKWDTRAKLGDAYLAAVTHAYGGGGDPQRAAGDGFRARVAEADALVHPQDDRERDILDGDGVVDYVGGFAAAAELLGNSPELYHLDTSRSDALKSRRFAEETARIVRGRLANPRWIAAMLAHGHRGVAEIAQGVDALYAFAATTGVPGTLFDAVHAAVIADDEVRGAMLARNPAAVTAIAARLRDALARGLWDTRRNAVDHELARALAEARS
ncbi:MAG: cobaltochelatase subunit CobN [Alphaproteobacteria bacterium]|nr:cobaltochelatase subunit CobN [Alphaproteobacteria bacterium]